MSPGVIRPGAGSPGAMSTPDGPTGLAATASASTEQSLEQERDAVGDHPDTGDLVPGDDAQSAPPPEGRG